MNSTASTPPLVSVIVRTMGRATLPQALEAVARQTHRPLEIVLVDAAEQGLTLNRHGEIPVRVAGQGRLDRPAAANAGLAAARGAWLAFLDEDDTIDPGHVAQLLAAAAAARLPVAYSQTRLVGADGATQRLLGGPFHREALRRSNYLPIHAVLFHRSLVDAGCRFDPGLAMFEDWDFWLQLAERTDFAFTGQATATYQVEAGASGAGGGRNLDREAVLAQRDRLLAKWGTGD